MMELLVMFGGATFFYRVAEQEKYSGIAWGGYIALILGQLRPQGLLLGAMFVLNLRRKPGRF